MLHSEKIIKPCAICGNPSPKIICRRVRDSSHIKVLSCKKCGLVYLEQPDNIKEVYDFYSNSYSGYYKQEEVNDARFQLIKPYLQKRKSVIEIGCSRGDFLLRVKPYAGRISGIELKKEDVRYARRNNRLNIFELPVEEFKCKEKFDIVCCFQVFEHIPDPNLFLRSLRKIIKPRGIIFIEVPSIDDPLLNLYRLPGFDKFYFKSYHLYLYSKETLRKILKKNGFDAKITLQQRYSLTNHLHWIYYGKRQKNTKIGYGIDFPHQNKASVELFRELDDCYKKLLFKRGYGNILWAEIRPKAILEI